MYMYVYTRTYPLRWSVFSASTVLTYVADHVLTNNSLLHAVLPNNMLHEKIYIFLWWWFAFIGVVTFLSMLVWMKRLAFLRSRRIFVCKFLKYMDALSADQDKRMWQTFVDHFLRHDGVFILHLIADKAGEIIAGEIVCQIYQFYR
jgi:innexin